MDCDSSGVTQESVAVVGADIDESSPGQGGQAGNTQFLFCPPLWPVSAVGLVEEITD